MRACCQTCSLTRARHAQDAGPADDGAVVDLEPAASSPNEVRGSETREVAADGDGQRVAEELQRQRQRMKEQQATPGLIEVTTGQHHRCGAQRLLRSS